MPRVVGMATGSSSLPTGPKIFKIMSKIRSVKLGAIEKDTAEYLRVHGRSFNGLVIELITQLLHGKKKNSRTGGRTGRKAGR